MKTESNTTLHRQTNREPHNFNYASTSYMVKKKKYDIHTYGSGTPMLVVYGIRVHASQHQTIMLLRDAYVSYVQPKAS